MRFWKSCACAMTLVLATGLVSGCAKDDAGDGATSGDSTAIAPPAAPTVSDAQIVATLTAANTADSAGGELAKSKGTDAEVKKFAQQMITDHGAANKQGSDLAAKLAVTPEDNDDSRKIQTDANDHMMSLAGKSGKDFDKDYIGHEVDMHQSVLDALDQKLIPNAQNAELRTLLTSARAVVEGHLAMAKTIKDRLDK